MTAFRLSLRRAVEDAAVPYGFTALIWTSGGVLVSRHGVPTLEPAMLFLAGVALGFGASALLGADEDAHAAALDPRLVGLASAVSAGLGLLSAAAVAELVDGNLAYGLVGLCATAVYFLAAAAGITVLAQATR